MTVSTTHSGTWYSIVGTVSEINDELNRINAKPERIVFGGNDGGDIILFVGRP
jgi:hypothetical protein